MSRPISSPPASSSPQRGAEPDLAGVMQAAFTHNSKAVPNGADDSRDDDDNRDVDIEIRPPEGFTMSSVYPPAPCERCVRTNKICKGVAGARCEHCKILHQKCSNSTGPPRGRHAVAHFQAHADPGSAPPRPKRKATAKSASKARSGDEEEDELDEDELDDRPKKKQVTTPSNGSSSATNINRRNKLLKKVQEIDNAVRQMQNETNQRVTKLNQLIAGLLQEIKQVD